MLRNDYERFTGAVGTVCATCLVSLEEDAICDRCPVRITCNRLHGMLVEPEHDAEQTLRELESRIRTVRR